MSEKNFDMDLLGRGAFGEVGQFVRAENKSFAIKKIIKNKNSSHFINEAFQEIFLLKLMSAL